MINIIPDKPKNGEQKTTIEGIPQTLFKTYNPFGINVCDLYRLKTSTNHCFLFFSEKIKRKHWSKMG